MAVELIVEAVAWSINRFNNNKIIGCTSQSIRELYQTSRFDIHRKIFLALKITIDA